jgi:hypothetical protein
VIDREQFASFGRRVAERLAPLVSEPLVREYWPLVLERWRETANLGACLAQARHVLEGRWGLQTLEVPQSCICGTESFAWFAAYLLAHLPRFHRDYNEALREYRQAHKIRSPAQPVPDLAVEGPWLEAPFWVWTAERPQRRRLLARQSGRELLIADGQGWETRLAISPDADGRPGTEQLLDLGRRGVKIRSRAMITTLWARLVLGDLFLHGIGGAKYDEATDRLIERFFCLPAPGFVVISATLRLPVVRPAPLAERSADMRRQLRELTYHPERFLAAGLPADGRIESLVAEKRRWITAPQTRENAAARWQAFCRLNEAMQPWLAPRRQQLTASLADATRAEQAEKILTWREYGFCLYPAELLQEFLAVGDRGTSQNSANVL